jgi:hypothetical protein
MAPEALHHEQNGGSQADLAWRHSSFCSNNTCVQVAMTDDAVLIRDSKHPDVAPLRFSSAEWSDFVAGVAAGEFSR